MKWLVPAAAAIALAALSAPAAADVTVQGRLLDARGAPLNNAYVSVMENTFRVRLTTDAAGHFETAVPRPGGCFLWAAAPNHTTVNVTLLVGDDGLSLEIRLGTPRFLAHPDSVFVIGDFNDFDDEDGRVLMRRLDDGTFAAEIPTDADTLAYQVLGAHEGDFPLSGTGAVRRVFRWKRPLLGEQSGQYAAVVDADSGVARVAFDPAALPPAGVATRVRFADPLSAAAAIYDASRDLAAYEKLFFTALTAYQRAGGDMAKFTYDWGPVRRDLLARLDGESRPIVRAYLLVSYFKYHPEASDSLLARRVYTDVAPDSPVWELIWGAVGNLVVSINGIAHTQAAAADYTGRVVALHPNREVRGAFLANAMGRAAAAGDSVRAAQIAAVLIDDYSETIYAKIAKRYSPGRAIKVGKPVPTFRVTALGDSATVYSDVSLRGRVYLLDFWAVWCGPCKMEMPFLHDAYRKYKNRGLTILSLSLDRKPRDVARFRKGTWKMPWSQAYLADGFSSKVAKAFEVVGIPRAVLVDKDGTILATDRDLRGERLDATLERVLGKGSGDDESN